MSNEHTPICQCVRSKYAVSPKRLRLTFTFCTITVHDLLGFKYISHHLVDVVIINVGISLWTCPSTYIGEKWQIWVTGCDKCVRCAVGRPPGKNTTRECYMMCAYYLQNMKVPQRGRGTHSLSVSCRPRKDDTPRYNKWSAAVICAPVLAPDFEPRQKKLVGRLSCSKSYHRRSPGDLLCALHPQFAARWNFW